MQQVLLENRAYIMPYLDVDTNDPHFAVVQKIGATGVLKGVGIPYKWANQTWFYPEKTVSQYDLLVGLRPYFPNLATNWTASGEDVTIAGFQYIIGQAGTELSVETIQRALRQRGMQGQLTQETVLSRRWVACLLEDCLHLFERPVNFNGELMNNRK